MQPECCMKKSHACTGWIRAYDFLLPSAVRVEHSSLELARSVGWFKSINTEAGTPHSHTCLKLTSIKSHPGKLVFFWKNFKPHCEVTVNTGKPWLKQRRK